MNFLRFLTFIALHVVAGNIAAQNFEWTNKYGATKGDGLNDVATKINGDNYFCGYYTDSILLDNVLLKTNRTTNQPFLAQATSAGDVVWAKDLNASTSAAIERIVSDKVGNVYVVGNFRDTLWFSSSFFLKSSLGRSDIFIAKFKPDGTFLWAIKSVTSGLGNSFARGVVTDDSSNVYVTVGFSGLNITFSSQTLLGSGVAGTYFAYLLKLDSSGQFKFFKSIMQGSNCPVYNMDIDEESNIYIVGNISNTALIGSYSLSSIGASFNGVVVKVNSFGDVIMANRVAGVATPSNGSQAMSISHGANGSFYVAGDFRNTAQFGNGISLTQTFTGSNHYFAYYDSTGTCKWAKATVNIGGSASGQCYDMRATSNGEYVYVTGNAIGDIKFGEVSTYNYQGQIFIAKLDSNGSFLWAFRSGHPTNTNFGSGIGVDSTGAAVISGYFSGSANFSSSTLTSAGNNDGFLVKISDIGISRIPLTKTVYCAGDSVYVPYTRYNLFNAGNTFKVQLSDSGGTFANPVVIGTLQSTNSGTIACKLPYNMLTSSGYQIRVMSDSPAVISYYLNEPITIYATPQAGAGADTLVCSGQPIPVQAQGGVSYQWLPGNWVTDSTGTSTFFKTPVNADAATQSFLVKLVAVAASGCSDTDTVVIHVKPKPVLHIPPDTTLCHGQTLMLKAMGSGGDSTAYSYSWINTTGQTLSAKDTFTVVADTSKSILIKLTDGCSQPGDSAVWFLQVLPSLKLTGATDTIVCEGGSVTYNLNALGGNGTAACYWSDGFIGSNRNIAVSTTTLSYTLTMADGCSDSVTKTITITPELNPVVNLTATPASGCIPLQVFIGNGTSNNSTTTYYWDKGDGNMQVNSDTFMLATYTASGVYSPKLILKSKRGCTGAQTLINGVTVLPKPLAAFSVNYDTTWITFPELTFTNQSTGADTFRWHFDDGSTDSIVTTIGKLVHSFTDSGHFEVQLVAQNTFGCTDTARQKIVVLQDFDVWIPNAFTPGTDSLNNTFHPVGVGIREYKLFIYNRWGQLVFESKGKLDRWNGCLQNELNAPLPDGTYGYYIELRNYKGRGFMYKGSVTLLR